MVPFSNPPMAGERKGRSKPRCTAAALHLLRRHLQKGPRCLQLLMRRGFQRICIRIIYTHVYIYIYICVCMYACMDAWMYVCMCVCVVCVYVCVCVYIYIDIYTYICIQHIQAHVVSTYPLICCFVCLNIWVQTCTLGTFIPITSIFLGVDIQYTHRGVLKWWDPQSSSKSWMTMTTRIETTMVTWDPPFEETHKQ